jgi:catechol-2,3-dioxygenase
VNIYVRNAEKSQQWYEDILGLHTYDLVPGRAAFMSANKDESHEVALMEVGENAPVAQQGQEILYLSRSTAAQECNEMKQYANLESQRIMAEAELVKSAAQEELEAEKIYAKAARLETESLEVLAQVRQS